MKPFSDGKFLKGGILITVNALCPLKGTTTGADILKDVLECLEENKLDLKKTCLCYKRWRSSNGRNEERFCFLT